MPPHLLFLRTAASHRQGFGQPGVDPRTHDERRLLPEKSEKRKRNEPTSAPRKKKTKTTKKQRLDLEATPSTSKGIAEASIDIQPLSARTSPSKPSYAETTAEMITISLSDEKADPILNIDH